MMFRSMTAALRTSLLLLTLCVAACPQVAVAYEYIIYEGGFQARDFAWEALADGSQRLTVKGGRSLDVTDEAELPAVDLLFVVPSDLAITDVRVEPLAVRRDSLPGPLATAQPFVSSTGAVVSQRHLEPGAGYFPAAWGMFGGLHSWRGYRLLAVTVHPARLRAAADGQAASIELLEQFAIHAVVSPDRQLPPPLSRERKVPGERRMLEETLRGVVANPAALATYQRADGAVLDKAGAPHLPTPNPSLEGSGVRYLIVTTAALAGEFQRLADHRTAQGLPAKVVTREWIAATQRQGIDFAETLRMYLQQAYSKWGLEFVLLGGDTDVIPSRVVRSYFYGSDGKPYTDLPTDLYFSALDGNWNANGNGWLAEPAADGFPGDETDMAPDLAVGRVTVRTPLGVQQFVDKVLTYEGATAADQYTNRILYAAEVLFPANWKPGDPIGLNGAEYAHTLNEELIQPLTDMSAWRMYQTDGGLYPLDETLSLAALIARLNSGAYGQVNQIGHGHYYNMSVADANFTVANADALSNAPNFFLLFTLNCASAAFDYACLAERFVENPHGGSIMSIGSARAAFPQTSFSYQYAFYQKMLQNGTVRAAQVLDLVRLQFIGNTWNQTIHRWTQLNLVLLGDPATGIWSGFPRQPQIAAPAAIAAGEQTVQVTVSVAGAPIAGADVGLQKGAETYAWGVTDALGRAWLPVIPQTAGEAVLTVAGVGLEATTRTIVVSGSAAYVKLDDFVINDSSGNGNGLPEAGETLSLQLLLKDVGGAGATGVSVAVESLHPDLTVLDGSASAPNIPPGGTALTSDPIVVQTPATLRDGTSVRLRVTVNAAGGSWVSQGELEILAPEAEVVRLIVDDAVYGNGDGIPQSGERLVLRPYVKNFGGGRLDQLMVQIIEAGVGVTVHSGVALYGGVPSLAEATHASGELSLTLADVGMPTPARLQFTDNYGRGFSQPLEFNPPAAPALPVADATIAPDAIALRWEPVGGSRTRGYHVYRATAAAGPFVRANQDLLRRASYYEDRPLAQLTSYWYKVTAVDTFMLEGAFSPVVAQFTMPAELSNFPLGFPSQTSSHLAVGDVTGDGRLEIIAAANEIYAWRDNGNELIDGDDNSQTTGPFTKIGGNFSPAGVVLANIDGLPGKEIIVSLMEPTRQIRVYRADGSMVPGWPKSLLGNWNWATPTVGDVTGDGFNEVVVNDLGGRTFVWRHDGTELRDGDNNPATDGVFVARPESWGFSSPVLYDLDGDGACEIIFGTAYSGGNENFLLAYKADGSQAPGFPFSVGTQRIICTPAIADLDRNGSMEIIFFTTGRRLYVLRANGTSYHPAFPVLYSGASDASAGPSPAVGNFDDDDDLEIVWPVNSGSTRLDLVLVNTGLHDGTAGTIMAGWPVQLPSNTEGSPVVGDINGDGRADIIQPLENGQIYAFNADGAPITGFPITLSGPCRTAPVICDLNGDGKVNLIYASNDNLVHAWSMPFDYNPQLVPWPTFKGDVERTGVARIYSATAVGDSEVPAAFTVLPPYPNPFNPATTIRLYVAPDSNQRLDVAVFDLRGRRVRELFAGAAEPGWRTLTWDGHDGSGRPLASGVYFVHARQADRVQTFKLALVK